MAKSKNSEVAATEVAAEPITEATPVAETSAVPVVPTYTIEDSDIPKRKGGRTSTLTYPLAQLTPGSKQSFFLPAADAVTSKKVATSVRTFSLRNGFKAVVREVEGGVRVWRGIDPAPAE